jgi:hypothetical protein
MAMASDVAHLVDDGSAEEHSGGHGGDWIGLVARDWTPAIAAVWNGREKKIGGPKEGKWEI